MEHGGTRVGAGRPGWHSKVEAHRNIDVRRFQRDGLIDSSYSGLWTWRDPDTMRINASVHITINTNRVMLRFVSNGRSMSQTVMLERTTCNFGGTRPWFRCPACNRRVALLFVYRQFACRRCHDLVYASQSEDVIDRAWRRQSKVESKLGGYFERPKGMHASTRNKLFDRLEACEIQRESAVMSRLLRHL